MRKQSDSSLMQAIYKASPVILDIHTALYYSTEWLILSSLHNYFIMRLVTYPAHGLGNFITPKVCVYTSCRNHTGPDKISKTFSRILLPFCFINMSKNKLDFMPSHQQCTWLTSNIFRNQLKDTDYTLPWPQLE